VIYVVIDKDGTFLSECCCLILPLRNNP